MEPIFNVAKDGKINKNMIIVVSIYTHIYCIK